MIALLLCAPALARLHPQRSRGPLGVRGGAESLKAEVFPSPEEGDDVSPPYAVTLSDEKMDELGIFDGDVVCVSGKAHKTLCVAASGATPAGAEDLAGAWCAMSRTRGNCRARVGSDVSVGAVDEGVAAATVVHVAAFADTFGAAGFPRDGVDGSDVAARCLEPYFASGNVPVVPGDHIECTVDGIAGNRAVEFVVVDVDSAFCESDGRRAVVPEAGCEFAVAAEPLMRSDDDRDDEVSYDDLGGIAKALATVRELVETRLKRPEFYEKVGVAPPRGVLLHGAPGCGKTSIARAVAAETGAYFFLINGAEILSKQAGEAEANLAQGLRRGAQARAVAHLPRRGRRHRAAERRQEGRRRRAPRDPRALRLMDELERDHANAAVVVLAATNRVNGVDGSLRRYGRLDKEVDMGVPDADARLDVLRVRTRDVNLADDVDLELLARDTHGFVGADIAQLCLEAAFEAIRGAYPAGSPERSALLAGYGEDAKLSISMKHFQKAKDRVNPSALRETAASVPKASWADVGGLEDVKRELKETVEYPVQHAAKFRQFGLPPSKGVLFYGPPGCGKTLLAQAVAHECGANFISIKGPELLTMWFGESEANVRNLFEKARASAPCILFFDEIDAIAKARGSGQGGASEAGDRVINQILTEIDGVGARKDVFVIGATNRPEVLDAAITRPGRLDTLVYIPLPDEASRRAVFAAALRNSPVDGAVDLDLLARATPGFSGADCTEVCKRAARLAIRDAVDAAANGAEGPTSVGAKHFEDAMATARRSVSDADLAKYDAFAAKQKVSADAAPGSTEAPKAFSFDDPAEIAAAEAAEEEEAELIYD
ncbi:ATP binding protein [Aureococcus anophagefferens]|nr:ATP binding protein [Aureococcus anophagefferens]